MNKMKKQALTVALGTTFMLTTVAPAIHAEQQAMPEVSNWAIEALNEGEKFGVFPLEWYYENFQSAISVDRLNTLMDLTEQKIASLNLKKNDKYTPVAVKGDNTRGDILNRLYNIVAQYDVKASNEPIAYLQQRQILRGSVNGLQLEQQATTEQAVIFAIRLIKDTIALAARIKEVYKVEPVVHLTCLSYDKNEIDSFAKEIEAAGITNILALRGDINPNLPAKKDFAHASDLISYLKTNYNFCIAGAYYPNF